MLFRRPQSYIVQGGGEECTPCIIVLLISCNLKNSLKADKNEITECVKYRYCISFFSAQLFFDYFIFSIKQIVCKYVGEISTAAPTLRTMYAPNRPK